MGCGCNKNKVATVTAGARRVTVYQVLTNGTNVEAEFESLQEARAKAVEVSGRVRVASKQV